MKFRNEFFKYQTFQMADESGGGGDGGAGDGDNAGDSGGAASDTGGDTGGDSSGDAEPAAWREDWKTAIARGDDKLAERASRYTSPEAVFEALVATQNKIRSGDMVAKLPENPTDEDMVTWRKDFGVPEKAEDYNYENIQEDDKDMVQEFSKRAHETNMTPAQAQEVLNWHYESQEAALNERKDLDNQQKQETLDTLNIEWGSDFRVNLSNIENLLSKLPDSVRDDFRGARMPDGTGVFNNPEVVRAFAQMATEMRSMGTLTPIDGDPMKGVTSEIDELETFMREKRSAYNKDEGKQARLRELYEIRGRLDRKAG